LRAAPWLRVGSVFWLDTLLLRRACRRLNPDLVHAWGMEKGAPLIAHRMGYPYVITVQGLYGWYKERVPLSRYDAFIERLERRCLPRAPVVTTESAFAVQYLKERYPTLRIQQAEHAPNRVFREVQRRPQTAPLHFISIGTAGHRKGTDLLFKALDELTPTLDFKLTVISSGDPHYFEALRPTVSDALWKRTELKHFIPPSALARELETPTMLLMPTRVDTSPNAVKEAVVAGLPVVASSVGGIPDYVVHGKNGLLFPPGDLAQFKSALQAACAHPLFSQGRVEAETLAQKREYLSPEAMARNFWQAYRMALERKRGTVFQTIQ
jgi:glycosyltransferase involved in cell wall biosynthesis